MAEWQTRRSQKPLMNNRKGSNPFLATTAESEGKEMKEINWDNVCLEHMTHAHSQCPSCLVCGAIIDPVQQTEAKNIEGAIFHKNCADDAKIQITAWKLLEEKW